MLSLCEETNAVSVPFAEQIFLTPNPANDMINIPNEGKTYTMYDVNGSIVFKGNASQLNISYWNAGMYVIVCGNKTGKFLKAN